MENAILIVLEEKGRPGHLLDDKLDELKELTRASGGKIAGEIKAWIREVNPASYMGKGKLEELHRKVLETGAQLVIAGVDLSPVQVRNIENACGVRVVDRTGLILDIFARRAKSHEGRLQVELAQLMYLLPRLTGHGVTMSRLGGGIGTRGPGEKKLEYDRRRIRERILRLKEDVDKIRRHRTLIRSGRRKKDFYVVAIVGYTNAGKSTLLNSLTGAEAFVEDKMFATLDPMTRIYERKGVRILFTDTVGFIIDLPPNLAEAFQATLEEINDADLVLHVIDSSHPDSGSHEKAVNETLRRLGVSEKPQLIALNKTDLMPTQEEKERTQRTHPDAVMISAKTKAGLDALLAKIKAISERDGWGAGDAD